MAMTSRCSVVAMIGASLILTRQFLSTSGGIGFVSPPRGSTYAKSTSALRGADRSSAGASTIAAAAANVTSGSSSGLLWLPLLGVAFAGIRRSLRRREADVSCAARHRNRWAAKFGGDGPPKTPEYLTKPWEAGTMVDGVEYPAWLTLQKWESFKAKNRARDMKWWVQVYDQNGFPAFEEKKEYTIAEAVDIQLTMNRRAPWKFDPSIEANMHMNLDPRFPDQQIRTSINLPHGTGKSVKVAVFCTDEEGDEVKAAGADYWGSALADDISKDNIDFDVLLAKPQMMPKLAKLGKILGPRRLMPSPKSGTVVTDYKKGIDAFKLGGTVELRMDRHGLVQCGAGKLSFSREQLIENFRAVLQELATKRPDGAKPDYWKSVYLGSSVAPSIKISASEFPAIAPKKKS